MEPLLGSPLHTVDFDIFAAFYRFKPGHRLRITFSTEDTPYLRPTNNPFIVTIHSGSKVTFPTGAWLSAPQQVAPPEPEQEPPPSDPIQALTDLQDLVFDFLGLRSPTIAQQYRAGIADSGAILLALQTRRFFLLRCRIDGRYGRGRSTTVLKNLQTESWALDPSGVRGVRQNQYTGTPERISARPMAASVGLLITVTTTNTAQNSTNAAGTTG